MNDFVIILFSLIFVIIGTWLAISKKKHDMIRLLYSGHCPSCGGNHFKDFSEVKKGKGNKNTIYMSYRCTNCDKHLFLDYVSISKKLSPQHSVSYWENNLIIINPEVKEENKRIIENKG